MFAHRDRVTVFVAFWVVIAFPRAPDRDKADCIARIGEPIHAAEPLMACVERGPQNHGPLGNVPMAGPDLRRQSTPSRLAPAVRAEFDAAVAPTVAFVATLDRGISAVRFTATLATSLLAAGLRTVAVTAVTGLAQDHLAPAQLAIVRPTLETHPPTPPCKGAWDSQLPEIRQEPAPCADTASPCLSNPLCQSLRTMATARQSTGLQVPAAVPGSAAHSCEKGSSGISPLSRRRVSRRASSADNGIGARAVM